MLPLAGTWTVRSFSDHLAALALFDHEPEQHAYLDYRRWAFESAALDLALRQAGRSLADVVGRTVGRSRSSSPPASASRRRPRLRAGSALPGPALQARRDALVDDALLAELAGLGCVDSIDFKGQYTGTVVDTVPTRPSTAG